MPFTKEFLSAGPNGVPVAVTGTVSSAPTVLHSSGTSTTTKDEVWLWAFNPGTAASVVTVQKAGTGALVQNTVSIPANSGAYEVVPGWPIAGGLQINAFSTSAVKPIFDGYVNRITP